MSGEISGVTVRIKEKYPEALFVHCYAHKLNLVLSQSFKKISACKRFFSILTGISAFFSRSTRRSSHLQTFVTRRIPRAAETRWNSHARLVGSVHSIFEDLKRFFKDIIENPRQWDDASVDAASGYLAKLSDAEFVFLLEVFHFIFPHTEYLFNVLQTKRFDIAFCSAKVKDVQNTISGFRNDTAFSSLFKNASEFISQSSRTRGNCESTEAEFRHLFFEIVDHILVQLSDRFWSISMLDFVELLDPSKISLYRHQFPKTAFWSFLKNFGRHFDRVKLEAELRAFYHVKEFENLFAHQILELLRTTELFHTMPQIVKLSELVLTVPSTQPL